MIPRYSRPDMTAIWDASNKFRIWFEIEAHACDALADIGVIPKEAAAAVWTKGDKPYTAERIERIDAIERETKHAWFHAQWHQSAQYALQYKACHL